MKRNIKLLIFRSTAVLLLTFSLNSYAQNDEKYYYKLGRKYLMMKDYGQSAKHFYKCLDLAKASGSENPNYYYYPALLFYYGEGKSKQVLKAMDLISPLIPEAPKNPMDPDQKKLDFFNDFFDKEKIQIDRSDYIFLRYYIQFKTGEIELLDAFERLEFCIMYHDPSESVIPISEVYKLLVEMYIDYFKDSADVEGYNKENHELVCSMFKAAAGKGNEQAREVVQKNCQ